MVLQQRSINTTHIGGYSWGIDYALDYLLNAINTGTVPLNPQDLEVALNRAINTGARFHRSRLSTIATLAPLTEPLSPDAAIEARIELARIKRTVKETDGTVLLDAGLGYTDRQIGDRRVSTPGAVRVRLSRLRLKLAG